MQHQTLIFWVQHQVSVVRKLLNIMLVNLNRPPSLVIEKFSPQDGGIVGDFDDIILVQLELGLQLPLEQLVTLVAG